ncbi:hypothetical protein GCM10011514_25170 [Emticicia aquatilis]|uniref:Uncharacterized protein n=1 Tax=Emticicia aquatilis TaxID=1537369 RepID=A0A916YT00_9BACT|nr:hypothetical protein [Emticicia aquatilis]GGD60194.1 hypothetical protein GCM10011514_25170 [Emticicia aquatilis]
MLLEEVIEKSYKLFESYTIGQTLDVCKRCCVSDADEARLVNTPLREVSSSVLRAGYFESARAYTDRELWEMKHFLPRVLELVSNFDFPCVSVEEVFLRLELHQPKRWTSEELQLLQDFSVEFFKKCLSYYPYSPDGDDISTYLTMFGVAHFPVRPILDAWTNAENTESTLLFKDFVINEFNYQTSSYFETQNENETFNEIVSNWLNDAAVKSKFSIKIDSILAEHQNLDADVIQESRLVKELLNM